MKSPLHSVHAPKPIGPYTQAMRAGDFVFISGQIGIDPADGKITGKDAVEQAAQALKNIRAILTAAGLSFAEVVKTTDLPHEHGRLRQSQRRRTAKSSTMIRPRAPPWGGGAPDERAWSRSK